MILITGATGLVGSQLLFDLIASGNTVRAMRRKGSSMLSVDRLFFEHQDLKNKIIWVEGDVNDIYSIEDAMDGVDTVYHSAAFISFYPSDTSKMMKVNVEGTANMVNIAMKKNVGRFCHVSSVAALGRITGQANIDENSWWKTSKKNSNYAISKYGGEQEVWRGMEEGLSAFIISPSIILGPGNWESGSSQMFSRVWKGLRFYAPGSTGFVDVRDVSKSAIRLMEKGITGERYIINAENVSYRYVFDLIAKNLSRRASSFKVTKFLGGLAWRVEALRSFIFRSKSLITKETVNNGFMNWSYSNEKIIREIGIEFIKVEDSLAETCRFFLKEKN